ncbi:unnamed protein product, partial [Rotaria magnacalcarata]
AKQALKHQQEPAANSSAASSSLSADSEDADEEVPDVDQDHEQLNLPPNSTTLWRIIPKLEHGAQYYSFSLFTMALNEWSEEGSKLRPSLAPTDSRFRPDI